MASGFFKSARLRGRLIVFLSVLLLILGLFLFYSSYRAQLKMQDANLGRWRHDNQLRAAALSYFYRERCNEIRSLAENATVTSFFLNKSLGMSLRYGLGSTLNAISQLFEKIIASQNLEDRGIYQAMVLLDAEGRRLCLARQPGFAVDETRRDWPSYLSRRGQAPEILTSRTLDGRDEVMVSVPVYFNQSYGGQLIGWIDFSLVYRVFAAVEDLGDGHAWVLNEQGIVFGGAEEVSAESQATQLLRAAVDMVSSSGQQKMIEIDQEVGANMLLAAQVDETPFILVERMGKHALGYYAPATYLIYMLVFALATVMIAALLLRSLVLNARFEEVVRRENEIAEKNKLLEKEITDRLRSEVDLAESRQRLTLVLKGADIGFWDWNVETDEVVHNHRLVEMIGYGEGEIFPVALNWRKLIHPDDQSATMSALKDHFNGRKESYEAEYRIRHKNGQWVWVLDRGAVVKRGSDGKPLRVTGTHLDITPRKKAEQELLAAHELLEKRVDERTRELREAQLALVNRALEEGRSQLAAMVLHNIGNAITPVAVYLEQFKYDRLMEISRYQGRCLDEMTAHRAQLTDFVNQNQRGREIFAMLTRLVEELPRDLKHCGELINKLSATISHVGEIISLQQSYAGVGREIKQTVDLNQLVTDTMRLQEDSIKKRQIEFSLLPAEPPPLVMIDKNRLVQVMVNLLKNSCEAIEQNEPGRLREIVLETYHQTNGEVGFSLRDSGIGIEKDQLRTIFTFGESGKGSSGFGLYYCKTFIEANQGRIEVESPGLNQGTKISVWLPAASGSRGQHE